MGPGDIRELLMESLLEGETWGMELIRRVSARRGIVLDQTKVYPTLQKMELEQLVTFRQEEDPASPGMQKRKFWSLTDTGRERVIRFQAWEATQTPENPPEMMPTSPLERVPENDPRSVTTTAPRENGSPVRCPRCATLFSSRFCPECGVTRTEAAQNGPIAPVPPPAAPMSPGGEAIAIFMQGFTTSMDAQRRANELARIDADERIRRYELDSKMTLERERMGHEKSLKERESFLDRADRAATAAAANMITPDAIAQIVRGEITPLATRIEQIETALTEEEEPEEPEEPTEPEAAATPTTVAAPTEGSILAKVQAANAVGREVGSFIKGAGEGLGTVSEVLGGVVKSFRGGTNGGSAAAGSGGS